MKFPRFLLLSICLSLIIIQTVRVPVLAHAALVRADPPPDGILDRAPSAVFTWFSQPLNPGSHLSIFDAHFQVVDKGTTLIDAHDVTLMHADLDDLGPGRYTVNWQAITTDGHKTTGSYDFVVRETDAITIPVLIGGGVVLCGVVFVFIVMRRPVPNKLSN